MQIIYFFHEKNLTVTGERKQNQSSPCGFIFFLFLLCACVCSGGMQAIFEVKDCKKPTIDQNESTNTRHYYIAAEEIIWNYGPTAINNFSGQELVTDG